MTDHLDRRRRRLLAEPMGLPRGLETHARADATPTAAERGRRIVWIDDDLAVQVADIGEWLAASGDLVHCHCRPGLGDRRSGRWGGHQLRTCYLIDGHYYPSS